MLKSWWVLCLECRLDNFGTLVGYSAETRDFHFLQNAHAISCACPAVGYHKGFPICVKSGRDVKLTIHFHLALRLKFWGTSALLPLYLLTPAYLICRYGTRVALQVAWGTIDPRDVITMRNRSVASIIDSCRHLDSCGTQNICLIGRTEIITPFDLLCSCVWVFV
jgi:hypothetical protein